MNIDWAAFTPYSALIGGTLIGLAAAMMIVGIGRVAGVSGVIGGLFTDGSKESWRWCFGVGLIVAPWLYQLVSVLPAIHIEASPLMLIVAGLLVGVGTRYGSGCTSGHGVCGLSSLSMRSFVATLIFMAVGFFTVYGVRHVVS